MSTIWDWSLTPGNNANADTAINWGEGMFPSSVNNSARQMMTRVAEYIKDNGVLDALGTNTIAVTSSSPITAITTGMTLAFRAAATNTTAVTLNLNGLGGKDIRKVIGGADSVPLAAGDINIKGIYLVNYDATANAGAGAWILINPLVTAASIGAVPLTGSLAMLNDFQTTGKFQANAVFASTSQFALLAANGIGAGRGVYLRPNGEASDVGQLTVNTSGVATVTSLVATSDVTTSQNFKSSTGYAVLAGNGSGVLLRPNGSASEAGQAALGPSGNFSAPSIFSSGNVMAGLATFQTNADLNGSIWTNWGNASAFVAIGDRIEARGAAYAASATSSAVAQARAFGGVGVDQSWSNLVLSNNTWATNATGQPIMVAIIGGGDCHISIAVANTTSAPATVASSQSSGSGVATVIPAGCIYKFNNNGSGYAGWVLQ